MERRSSSSFPRIFPVDCLRGRLGRDDVILFRIFAFKTSKITVTKTKCDEILMLRSDCFVSTANVPCAITIVLAMDVAKHRRFHHNDIDSALRRVLQAEIIDQN